MGGARFDRPPSQRSPTGSARLVVLALALTLTVAVVLTYRDGTTRQVFTAAGAARRVVLPLVYLLMAFVILRRSRGAVSLGPVWLWVPLLGGLASFAINLGDFLHTGVVIDAVQGLLLLAGFTLIGVAGVATGHWSERDRRLLLYVLLGASLAATLMPYPTLLLVPYTALVVPAVFSALLMGLRGPAHREMWLMAALVIALLGARGLRPAPGQPISIAVLGQIAIAAAVVLIVLLPRQFRAILLMVGAVALVGLLLLPVVRGFLTGHYTGEDVTLAQRAFEARETQKTVMDSPLGLVVGRGPAATVDLTHSPDSFTLILAGRDLTRVDDVHLVTSYLLLKLGLFGIAWLVWLLVTTYRFVWSELCSTRVDTWRVCLIIFVLCGMVTALPAGTELLSNPFIPLFLAILWADRRPTVSLAAADEVDRRVPPEPRSVTDLPTHLRTSPAE